MSIDEKYPSTLDKTSMSTMDYIKARTIELYDYLPQTTLEERSKYTDIRDEVIRLNYKFFGYIAVHTFVPNTTVTYEDKFQSAVLHFCEMWAKYRFAKKYRTDLAFTVFFKPRLSECIKRELRMYKASTDRTLRVEAGKQLDKHWTKVTYEDLSKVDMPAAKINSLKAIFNCMNIADLDVHSIFISSKNSYTEDLENLYSDEYDSILELLIHEMVENESLLKDKDLLKIAEIQDISYETLYDLRPQAEEKLYNYLVDCNEIHNSFN